jgi:hypothetical protein
VACCGKGSGNCNCRVQALADDGCTAVRATVTGAGSIATPYRVGATLDMTRLFTLNGDEPWKVATVGGCSMLTRRASYEMA